MDKQVINLTIFMIKDYVVNLEEYLKFPHTLPLSTLKDQYGLEGSIFYCDSRKEGQNGNSIQSRWR